MAVTLSRDLTGSVVQATDRSAGRVRATKLWRRKQYAPLALLILRQAVAAAVAPCARGGGGGGGGEKGKKGKKGKKGIRGTRRQSERRTGWRRAWRTGWRIGWRIGLGQTRF